MVHPVVKLCGETMFTCSGHARWVTVSRERSPPRTLVSDPIRVSCSIFCTNIDGPLGTTKSWTLEKSIVCRISVSTLPCEVRTQPASTKLRDEVVATVPTTGSAVGSIPCVVILGLGTPMVFSVTSPVTRLEPRSRKSSSVAVVEKYRLLLVTLIASLCGRPA